MLIGAHVSTAGGLQNAVGHGVERGCEAIQIFHQSPRAWRPTNFEPGRLRRLQRGIRRIPARRGGDPRRLPDQHRDPRRGDPREVAELAPARDPARRRDRRRRRRPPRRLAQEGPARRGRRPLRRGRPRGPRRDRELPDPVREHRRDAGPARPRLRRARDARRRRRRRRSDRRLHRLLPPLRLRLLDRRARGAELGRRRPRRASSAWTGCAACTSTTAPSRWAPTATSTPTSARARWGPRGIATFLSEPRFEDLPALLETPGPDKHGSDFAEVARAKELREEGLRGRGA